MSTGDDTSTAKGGFRTAITGGVQLFLVIAVVLVGLGVNRALMNTRPDAPTFEPQTAFPAVAVIRPSATEETIRVAETGTVQTRANVALAPQVGGRVVAVSPNLAAGGAFAANEELFAIDPTDLQLSERQARADLETAESALLLEQAEAETARREWRLVNGDEPIPALVAREPQIAQAKANVSAARARLADVRTDLGRTRYALPFDGRVVSTTIEPGQTLAANQSYGQAYNVEALEVVVPLSEDMLDLLEPAIGRAARVRRNAKDENDPASAHVVRVSAELDAQTRLAGIVLAFDEPPSLLPGAFVQVMITGDVLKHVFRMPADAVAAGDVMWVVDDGALGVRTPRVIARQADAVIVEAFDFADGVVITLPPGAREGMPVTVIAAEGAGAPERASAGG